MSRILVGVTVAAFAGLLMVSLAGRPTEQLQGQLVGTLGGPVEEGSACDPAIFGWKVQVRVSEGGIEEGSCEQERCAQYFNERFSLTEQRSREGRCTWYARAPAACAWRFSDPERPQGGYTAWEVIDDGRSLFLGANADNFPAAVFTMELPRRAKDYGTIGRYELDPFLIDQLMPGFDVCRLNPDAIEEIEVVPLCNAPPVVTVRRGEHELRFEPAQGPLRETLGIWPQPPIAEGRPCSVSQRSGGREVLRLGLVSAFLQADGSTSADPGKRVTIIARDGRPGMQRLTLRAEPPLIVVQEPGSFEVELKLQGDVLQILEKRPRNLRVVIEALDQRGNGTVQEMRVDILPDRCGDGRKGWKEQCDDGNTEGGDGCSVVCSLEGCGNGMTDTAAGEQCDDGNTAAGDGCSASCRWEYCGDGVTQGGGSVSLRPPEECDDGKHCVDGQSCTEDDQCVGRGLPDESCVPRSFDGCSLWCATEVGCCQSDGSFSWELPGQCVPRQPGPVRNVRSPDACTELPVLCIHTQGGWKELPFAQAKPRKECREVVVRENDEGEQVSLEIEAPHMDYSLIPVETSLEEFIKHINEKIYKSPGEEEEEDGAREPGLARPEHEFGNQPLGMQRDLFDGYCALPGADECIGVDASDKVDSRMVCFTKVSIEGKIATAYARTKVLCEYYAGIGAYRDMTEFSGGKEMFPEDFFTQDRSMARDEF